MVRRSVAVRVLAVLLVVVSGLLSGGVVPEDFDLRIAPAATDVAPSGAAVALQVLLTNRDFDIQGWSMGVKLVPDAGVTATITELAHGPSITTSINDGGPAEFQAMNWYPPGDLTTCGNTPEEKPPYTGIAAGAFNQGITIHMLTVNQLPADTTDLPIVDFTVEASGPVGAQVRAVIAADVGDPATATVFVVGGMSIPPGVQDPAVITFVQAPAPDISNIQVDARARDATITWETDLPADSVVDYGAGGLTSQASDPGFTTFHAITLTDLTPETTYQFEVTSTTAEDGTKTVAGTFVTAAESGPCPAPSSFTLEIEGGLGVVGERIDSVVTLNFNADGSNEGALVQGWSYGICIADPVELQAVAATIEGTDTATANNGEPPDYDVATIYPDGVTHAVTVHILTMVKVPAHNDWTDLVVTYEPLSCVNNGCTYVNACNKALGDPPVENVMVVAGMSTPLDSYEGPDPAADCCDPSTCNIPGWFSYCWFEPVWFLPGNANGDRRLDLADGVFVLLYLFRSGLEPPCLAAADFNGDGIVDASDAVATFFYCLQPTQDDLVQTDDDYGSPPPEGWPGPALGTECVLSKPGGLSCEVEQAACF